MRLYFIAQVLFLFPGNCEWILPLTNLFSAFLWLLILEGHCGGDGLASVTASYSTEGLVITAGGGAELPSAPFDVLASQLTWALTLRPSFV